MVILATGFSNGVTSLHFGIIYDFCDEKLRSKAIILMMVAWAVGGILVTLLF